MLIMVVAKLIALAVFFIWMEVLFPAVYFKQMCSINLERTWKGGTQALCIWRSTLRCNGFIFWQSRGWGRKPRFRALPSFASMGIPLQFHCNSTPVLCHGPQDSVRLGHPGAPKEVSVYPVVQRWEEVKPRQSEAE